MTERRKEQALQAQTDLPAAVFEIHPHILMLVDENARVDMVNRAGSQVAKSLQGELIGLQNREVFHCINSFDGKC